MAWTLEQQSTYTNDATYRARVQNAFLKTAHDVMNEAANTANHAQRVLLAEQVLFGSGIPPRAPSLLHILNPALQVNGGVPTDNDILFTVSQQWDYFSPDAP